MYDPRAVEVGLGRLPSDEVMRGGLVVDIPTADIGAADVVISDDPVAAIGDVAPTIGAETEVIDASGMHPVPGLIDPHVHTEVTKMSITSCAEAVLPHATTSVCTAFDQIAPVKGI